MANKLNKSGEKLAKLFVVGRGGARQGSGRKSGSYKYSIGGRPVSIEEFKAYQRQRQKVFEQFQQKENQRFAQRGYSPEQIEQLKARQRMTRPSAPRSVAEQELAFEEYTARNSVTPNTQRILENIRRIQLKGKRDDIQHQRRIHERNLVSKQMNLMKAHENMNPVKLDFTGVNPEENILFAPSVFKENRENFILKKKRPSILETGSQGNNLNFWEA